MGLFGGQQIERLVIAALREVTLDEAMDRARRIPHKAVAAADLAPWAA